MQLSLEVSRTFGAHWYGGPMLSNNLIHIYIYIYIYILLLFFIIVRALSSFDFYTTLSFFIQLFHDKNT